MKIHPTVRDEGALISKAKAEEVVGGIIKNVYDDANSRQQWLRRQAHFLRRRYTKEFRQTGDPWPGASDIVMPIIDMSIDRLAPVFVRSTIGTRPVSTVIARNPESLPKVPGVEMFLDWLIETRSTNFAEEVAYAVDSYLQHGMACIKVWYDYRTRVVREVIDRTRLPEAVQRFVRPELSPEEANAFLAQTGIPFITPEEFAESVDKNALREGIRRHFGLDPEEPLDKKAEDDIVRWILAKKPAKSIVIRRREVIQDTPRITAIAPEDIIVHDGVTDLQRATRVTHRMIFNKEELLGIARDRKWSMSKVKSIMEGTQNRSPYDGTIEAAREALHNDVPTVFGAMPETDQIELWEVYTHLDLDGDGVPEKVVLTIHPDTKTLLQAMELPYNHGLWPFVHIKFEHADKRFYRSRGVPEKLNDLDVEITSNHRAKLNSMAISNSPTFTYRLTSGINPDTIRFIPGGFIPVQRDGDVRQLDVRGTDLSFEREEQVLASWVERYVGMLDVNLGDQGRLTRPRTATEIQLVGNIASQVSGVRVLLWQRGMSRVYNMLFDLWVQWGPEEVFVRVTGEDAGLTRMTRHEIQGDFDFVPTPAALNNPQTALQEAQAQLLTLTQVAPLQQVIEPRFELNLGEAVLAFLEAIDSRRAKRIIRRRSPEEVRQIQAAQAAQAAQLAEGETPALPTGAALPVE